MPDGHVTAIVDMTPRHVVFSTSAVSRVTRKLTARILRAVIGALASKLDLDASNTSVAVLKLALACAEGDSHPECGYNITIDAD